MDAQLKPVRLSVVPSPASTPLFGESTTSATGERVRKYFETSGFSRWTAIYGQGDIPPIWGVIRDGHQKTIDVASEWASDGLSKASALDAGCGTGNLALALADRGFSVDAFDVSAPMVHFARYMNAGRTTGRPPTFHIGDIAGLEGSPRAYDLVACIDVLFHYPHDEVVPMLQRLARLSDRKIVGSFALRTPMNDFWMMVGQRFFHAKNRMTKLHLLSYEQIEQCLDSVGFTLTRTQRVKYFFYDSFVFEAVRRG